MEVSITSELQGRAATEFPGWLEMNRTGCKAGAMLWRTLVTNQCFTGQGMTPQGIPQLQSLYDQKLSFIPPWPLQVWLFCRSASGPQCGVYGTLLLSGSKQASSIDTSSGGSCESNAMLCVYILCRETFTITGHFSSGQISEEKQCDLPSLESSPRMRSCHGGHALQAPVPH